MKNNYTIAFGSISAITAAAGLISLILILFDKNLNERSIEEVLVWLGGFIPILSTIIYLVKTEFWRKGTSEIKKIEIENQLIKKQIEQKKLKNELNQLDN